MWQIGKFSLLSIVLLMGMAAYGYISNHPENQSNISQQNTAETKVSATSTMDSTAKNDLEKISGYDGPYTHDLAEIGNQHLTTYVINTALEKCPFYEGGGAMYRMCLTDLRKQTVSDANVTDTQLSKIENECLEIAKSYKGSTIAGEMYDMCVAALVNK